MSKGHRSNWEFRDAALPYSVAIAGLTHVHDTQLEGDHERSLKARAVEAMRRAEDAALKGIPSGVPASRRFCRRTIWEAFRAVDDGAMTNAVALAMADEIFGAFEDVDPEAAEAFDAFLTAATDTDHGRKWRKTSEERARRAAGQLVEALQARNMGRNLRFVA